MRTLPRHIVAALVAVSLVGCTDESDPLAYDSKTLRPSRYEGAVDNPSTTATSPDIALLGIHVHGPDLETPLVYQIPLNTVATGSIHSCGLAGTLAFCWGSNVEGPLGIDISSAGSTNTTSQVTNGPMTPSWTKTTTGTGTPAR